jgi:hypothetical protein
MKPTARKVAKNIIKNNKNNPALGEYIVPKSKYGRFEEEGLTKKQNKKMNKIIVRKTKNINTRYSPQGLGYES